MEFGAVAGRVNSDYKSTQNWIKQLYSFFFRIKGLAQVPSLAQVHSGLVGVHLRRPLGRDRGAVREEGGDTGGQGQDLQEYWPHQGTSSEDSQTG